MRVIGLDGREVAWKLAGLRVDGGATRPRSSLHLRARDLLRRAFPLDIALEEVPIPGSSLRLDFFVPTRSLAVEVQGEQHFKSNAFHHKTPGDFRLAVARDRRKADFCAANGIRLAALRYDEDDDAWRRTIEG